MDNFKKYLVLLCALLIHAKVWGQNSTRPNFIFVLTDDQPYGYMGCTGNEVIETPNLDRLANEGILFTNAHVTSAICTPSRASILLSQYERKHGINFNSGTSLSPEGWKDSYPMVFKGQGYYTGWIGKNHVPVGEGGYGSGLMDKSFDFWYAGHGHLGFYPKERHNIFTNAKEDTQIEIIDQGVSQFLSNSDKIDGAMRFLRGRPADKPFMLSVCFNLPHSAGTRTMEMRDSDDPLYKSHYRDEEMSLPENYVAKEDIHFPKLPKTLLRTEDRQTGYNYVDDPASQKEIYIRQLQAVTGIDRFVGNLRMKLEEEGIADNTIIVFTSDHGLFMGEFGLGGKALCYEVTTHVPLIWYDPAFTAEQKGRKSDELVQTIDIAPTMLQRAGIGIPGSYQGKDLTGFINGDEREIREYLFTENLWSTQFGNPRCEAVQSKKWKYIRYYKNNTFSATRKIKTAKEFGLNVNAILYTVHDADLIQYRDFVESSLNGEIPVYEELFDLENDPNESNNLAADIAYKNVIKEMRAAWSDQINIAKGIGKTKVLRYTYE
ncbi:sulfatase-like hydrolase/transferase, partial [Echinicola sediminis]